MKKIKLLLVFIAVLFFLHGCKSVKEGLTGTKRAKSADEFFVKKKSPLVLPPNFEDLPSPNPQKKVEKLDDTEIEDLLGIYDSEKKDPNDQGDNSLENSILEKIKNF